jgi:hypothetical protein
LVDSDEDTRPLPWHFKLLAGAVAIYLAYRALQGIVVLFVWLAGHV